MFSAQMYFALLFVTVAKGRNANLASATVHGVSVNLAALQEKKLAVHDQINDLVKKKHAEIEASWRTEL